MDPDLAEASRRPVTILHVRLIDRQIIQRQGLPKPFIPRRDNMAPFRKIAAGTTARFMKSSFARQTLASLPNSQFTTEDRKIPVQDGTEIGIRIYQPDPAHLQRQPVCLLAHGGGFCMGGFNTDAFICELLCRSLNLIVLDIDYRLAPETKYSTIVSDVYDAVKWVRLNSLLCLS